MTTYNATRESEQLRYLEVDIASFILRYASKPMTPGRRTLFLFPGGMGSQLLRARTPYQNNGGPQTFEYDNYWLSPLTFLGGALFLGMHRHGSGFRDHEDKIVIPYGAVNFFGFTPYSRFTQWCELNDLDWFIFGWDWRRRLDDTVSFFFDQFLPLFRSTVQQQCGVDPLQDFILMGHSSGGMVVKLMLHQGDPAVLANMTRAVTAASPFYGYDGQILRWFEGEPYLNQVGPFDVTLPMIKVITSLPGCYVLPYLDYQTFLANQLDLQNDPNYPLISYPSTDAITGQPVDPFDPGPNRYPTDTGFDLAELAYALTTYQTIADDPPAAYASKFFNIRAIQSPTVKTTGSITWGALTGPLDPHASPITRGPDGLGDDTQPAWSTRLVTLGANQIVPVTGNVDHISMMEYNTTQAAIASVL
jgi:hypothetical protein